jgi:hypothetical protein
MWELTACIDGVNYANNPDKKVEPPTDEEFEQMLRDYDHLIATRN